MSDPKARKVIVIENPLLPTRVKEVIAEVLFDNLQVSAQSAPACDDATRPPRLSHGVQRPPRQPGRRWSADWMNLGCCRSLQSASPVPRSLHSSPPAPQRASSSTSETSKQQSLR